MYRNTIAALAALVCLIVCPELVAARPTRLARTGTHIAAAEPQLRATRSRAGRRSAANRRAALVAIKRHASPHYGPNTVHATSETRRPRRGRRPRRDSDDDSSFVALSARAAAERQARHGQDVPRVSLDDPELRSRLLELDATSVIPSLLPPPRTHALYDERGRLIIPAPMRGSHEVLLHQNEMADHDGLACVQDDEDLAEMRQAKQLVPLPTDETLRVDERLPEDRRYSRPWTAVFLTAMARDFYTKFHAQLQVDSAVRTVDVQKRLDRTNGNAAPAEGATASPHLTGQAIDVAKRGLTLAEIAWLRLYLQPLMDAGKIDVEEEFRQACFHISVYKSYMPTVAATRLSVAAAREQTGAEP